MYFANQLFLLSLLQLGRADRTLLTTPVQIQSGNLFIGISIFSELLYT